jgi:hypothetical protein
MQEFEEVHQEVNSSLEVLGFIDIADIASPQALSRHLVLPLPNKDAKASSTGMVLFILSVCVSSHLSVCLSVLVPIYLCNA